MRVLALDTTTRTGSVAVVDDDRVIAERGGDPSRTHAERLPREIETILGDAGIRSADIDVFAVASGPGSFTGLRIGIATIQGFAFVHRRPVAAVSALDALAVTAGLSCGPGAVVGAWMDAHRRDVFSSLYRTSESHPLDPIGLLELESAEVGDPTATLDRWKGLAAGNPIAFIGDGASMWADTIRARYPDATVLPQPLLAGVIGRIALRLSDSGKTVGPADVRPLYIRRPDAEIARDARVSKAGTLEAG